MEYREEYLKWRYSPVFDSATRAEVGALTDEREIADRFYKGLTFGTGGLRGVIGAGTNRMNIYTVGKATQGLAGFINSKTPSGSVVIAHDSRKMSREFALDSALVLAANGIRVYLFEDLRPTPELSYAVRALNATAGIVITASHNPPKYNGYKVYWSDGGQIVPPYDKLIIDCVNAVKDYADIRRISREEAELRGLLKIIGEQIDGGYISAIKSLVLNPEAIAACAKSLKIVYTPLNGTGNVPVRRVLRELGFENVWVVPEQEAPDGNFPTLKYPNPEDPAAFELALKLARQADADIVLATDPDADRLGVYAKDDDGQYVPFTGNMSGLLIADYVLSQRREKGLLPENPSDGAIVTTIVSSDMVYPIAKEYGLTVIRTLTGFKYIGEQIKLFEKALAANGGKPDGGKGAYVFQFGYEESYGCLVGTHARDKDAVAAVTMLCGAAAYYKTKGKTLWRHMQDMYKKYGWYRESLQSITIEGADGAEKISAMCEGLRNNPPESLGGCKVLQFADYKRGTVRNMATGEVGITGLPESDVLYFTLENSGWCCVRPSGTEPKIKFYFGAKGDSEEQTIATLEKIAQDMKSLVGKI